VKKTEKEATAASASVEDVLGCEEQANALVRDFLSPLFRQERTLRAAVDYVLALGPGTRANCWELGLAAGHPNPDRMQSLLSRRKWDHEQGLAMLPALAGAVLGDGDPGDMLGAGVAFDETADLKTGSATACVSPQHAGVTGRVENCVTWVFAALVTARAQAWAWFGAYMPEETWAKDAARRAAAGIPDGVGFATKPQIAIAQLRKLLAAGLRFSWVAADEVYGRSGDFRAGCRARGLSYVVIVPCGQQVRLAKGLGPVRADSILDRAVFEMRSAGDGAKGPRYAQWALFATADPGEFLMVRKLDREQNQYTYYLCHAAAGRPATLAYFATAAGRRWPVETTFRTGKDAFGWDQSQVRTWTAMHRHTLLTALAQIRAIALRNAMTREKAEEDPALPPAPAPASTATAPSGLRIPAGETVLPATAGLPCPAGIAPVILSPAETLRIVRVTRQYADGLIDRARLALHYRWSAWRRRHQARARWHHYSARLAALAT
jgi:hypothetical protein